jgi:cytochrome c oxidase subunit 2
VQPVAPKLLLPPGPWTAELVACALVFSAALLVIVVALHRRAGGGLRGASPAQWPALAGIAALLLAIPAAAALLCGRLLDRSALDGALHVEMTAHPWWWEVHYRGPYTADAFHAANEIHVPVGRPVFLTLHAGQAFHSFWLPSLHGKQDLPPGRTATVQFRADQPGIYRGECAEFCGNAHAFMSFEVIALAPDRFEHWLRQQRGAAAAPHDAGLRQGHDLFLASGCGRCHTIRGTAARGRGGPDLTHLGSRSSIAAGSLPNNTQYLKQWITRPQQFKPGVDMPPAAFQPHELDAVVRYLVSLK